MNHSRRRKRSAIGGFTLVEALVAIALMGIVLSALSTVTARWLRNWDRGFARAERGELVSIALDRLIADLSAAEFLTANRNSKVPVFDGTSSGVILVRRAFGPNSGPGLELVRIVETSDRNGTVLVRSKKMFAPMAVTNPENFIDPVALMRAPLRVTFEYAGRDELWKDTWREMPLLPAKVRVTVNDAASARTLSISTAALVHVELPAACVGAKDESRCFDRRPEGEPGKGSSPQPQGAPASLGAPNAERSP